jgi:FAD/FMN-containing dehydrogenase
LPWPPGDIRHTSGSGVGLASGCIRGTAGWAAAPCHQLISVDLGAKTAVIQPGMALDKANDALAGSGLMVGPKPSR